MLKRANKVTALVVAAASVMTLVPAMATEKLGAKDGHIYNAVAYKDGAYAYYGYRTDDDDKGIWYNSGSGSDKAIDDLEDYELGTDADAKYADKYAYVTESGNSDEYLVDLSSGDIADEDTPEDQEASAKAKLTSALKKAERYNNTSDSDYELDSDDVAVNRLFQNQFGELWYQYATTGAAASSDVSVKLAESDEDYAGASITTSASASITAKDVTFGTQAFTGFTNTSGKYIDASYLANLKVYNARKGKATTIEQFGKLYKDEAIQANLVGLKALAQDSDNIYALATVNVLYYPEVAEDEYDFSAEPTIVPQYFIQKISKERGTDKEDGAYLPKSVESWQLDGSIDGTNVSEIYEEDGDRQDAFDVVIGQQSAQDGKSVYSVKDGVLYVTTFEDLDDDNEDEATIHTWKLKLGKDKIDVVNQKIKDTHTFGEDDDYEAIDTNVVYLDADDDSDVEVNEDGKPAYSIDVEGNVWALTDGEIVMFDGSEWKTQFKCDQSYNSIDVYDKDSLIAWEYDDDSYTTVKEGKTQTVDDAKVVDPNLIDKTTVKTGWVQNGTAWTFFDATGAQVKGNWVNDKGVWYYLNADGNMATGWVQVAGTWYYLNTSGAMQTGWVNAGGTWYYLKSSGAMATGWLNDSGTWYYLNASGAMLANTTVDGYTLGSNGAWIQ